MAKEILEQNVRRKVEAFLVSQGQTVEDLTEGQLTELYWNILSESIGEAEEKRVTQYDFSKEGDIEEFNRDKDNVDGEDITVGDDGAQISEDEIDEMVRENQNAVMSKSELIQEMRRQLVTEANVHDDDLESGDNDYARHLDPDSVRDMGRELYNDIASAAREKFGDNVNLQSATQAMSESLMRILQFEMDKKERLTQEAVKLVREKYGALTEDAVDIDAEITGHPGLGGREIQKGNVQYERGTTPPPEGKTEEELKPEITKRRIINGMTHGAARKGQNLYHMAGEALGNTGAAQDYSKVMAANDFMYWAIDKQTLADESQGGTHAGNVRVVIQESGKPKIIAQGMTFSFLLHELVKGVMELMSLHGTAEDNEVRKYVEDKTDHLGAEPDDIRLGVGIWEKVSRFIDIENEQHEATFYHKLVTLPAEQFNELMRGLVRGDRDSVQRVQAIADEASADLRQEEYDDAMGTYDEPTEQPPMEDDGFPDPEREGEEGQYSDPELNRILGGQSQEEPQGGGEPDYANMSRRELQGLMDDALDAGDFELASKIGPHLH
jgi:hypothetical protein